MEKNNSSGFPSELIFRWITYKNDNGGLLDFENKLFDRQQFNVKKNNKSKWVLESLTVDDNTFAPLLYNIPHDFIIPTAEVLYLVNDMGICTLFSSREALLSYMSGHPQALLLLRVFRENGCVYIASSDIEDCPTVKESYKLLNEQVYKKMHGCMSNYQVTPLALKQGDVIKLGRVRLTVRHLVHGRNEPISHLHNLIAPESPSELDSSRKDPDLQSNDDIATCAGEDIVKTCRICLCDDDTSGPLITPCSCKGSLNYVHLSCIRSWIKGRLNCCDETGAPSVSYFWQKLQCELCGTSYPSYINVNDKETELLDIEQPSPPYAVLEPDNVQAKGYFIVSLAKKPAIIGRGHDCDVRLTDISVSRLHSRLFFSNGHFIIEDKKSKFGTLVHNGTSFKTQLIPGIPICLKIGNGILCVALKKSWKPFSLCFGGATNNVKIII